MWYIGGEELQPLHARSDDGIEWSRPALGPAEAEGGARSNLVNLGFEADRKERRLVLCRPDREGAGPARYLALTRVGGRLKPLESDDGLSWRFHEDHPGIPSDDEYRLGYDGEGGVFIATVKRGGRHGGAPFAVPEYGRTVSVSTSPDGLEWTDPEVAFHADFRERAAGAEAIERHLADDSLLSPMFVDPDHSWTDVYNMPVFRYEGFYLALPVMFHQCGFWQYPGRPDGHNQDGLLWPGLAWSRDLRDWRRPHRREPFIPLSACDDPAIYDNGAIHACAPVRRGDELWFYYYGSRFSHVGLALLQEAGLAVEGRPNGAVYLAKLRLDGFASYHGGEQPGVILTRPVVVGGSNLRINARAEGGEIRAELRDAETGRVIPGFSMGDLGPTRSQRTCALRDAQRGNLLVRLRGRGVVMRGGGRRCRSVARTLLSVRRKSLLLWPSRPREGRRKRRGRMSSPFMWHECPHPCVVPYEAGLRTAHGRGRPWHMNDVRLLQTVGARCPHSFSNAPYR
jgi:hypothetical protein